MRVRIRRALPLLRICPFRKKRPSLYDKLRGLVKLRQQANVSNVLDSLSRDQFVMQSQHHGISKMGHSDYYKSTHGRFEGFTPQTSAAAVAAADTHESTLDHCRKHNAVARDALRPPRPKKRPRLHVEEGTHSGQQLSEVA